MYLLLKYGHLDALILINILISELCYYFSYSSGKKLSFKMYIPFHNTLSEKNNCFFTNLVFFNTANESTLGIRGEEEEDLDVSHTQQNPPPLLSRVNECVCISLPVSVYFYC